MVPMRGGISVTLSASRVTDAGRPLCELISVFIGFSPPSLSLGVG